MNFLIAVAALVVVLGVLVFVHEAGHFIAAKWAGIYVHRFSLGIGSPIRRLTVRRGETEYSISWLPLGGYVKMASQEEAGGPAALEGGAVEAEVPPDRYFEAKPLWKRMIVILAGVTMNVLFALVVYIGLAWANGEALVPITRVGAVIPGLLPADAAPLKRLHRGDRIVAVNGRTVRYWSDILEGIANGGGADVEISLDDGRTITLPIPADAVTQRVRAAQALQPFQIPLVDSVIAGSPAATAGIRTGDTIRAVGGQPIRQWLDLQEMMDSVKDMPTVVTVARGGETLTFPIHPTLDTTLWFDSTTHIVGRLGVSARIPVERRPLSFLQAVRAGGVQTANASTQILRGVRGMVTGRVSRRELGGPILIAREAGTTAQLGPQVFLAFMALISVNLAVLNLLPIPVLDGGQFLFLLAEAVLRRPLPQRIREGLTTVGLLLIVLLMLFAFSNDILRLFGR